MLVPPSPKSQVAVLLFVLVFEKVTWKGRLQLLVLDAAKDASTVAEKAGPTHTACHALVVAITCGEQPPKISVAAWIV